MAASDGRGGTGAAGGAPACAWHAELAWLPEVGVRPNVLIQAVGDRFTAVTPGVSAADVPAGTIRLAGLTLPGLANAHSHAFHRALRGITQAGRGTFWTWRERMYEVAGRLDPDSYLDLARAVYAEMALAGITCVGEFHYLHHDRDGRSYADPNEMGRALIEAATQAGLRICLLDTCYLSGGLSPAGEPLPLSGAQLRFGDGDAAAWAARVDALGVDVRGVDVRGADVRGVDVRGVDVRGADVRGADVLGVDVLGVDVRGVDVLGVDVRGVDVRGADVRGADVRGADVRGADERGADERGADERGADERGMLSPLARIGAAIHSVRAVPPGQLGEVIDWADRRVAPLHAHLSEQRAENEACLAAYGRTPAGVLQDAGALGPRSTVVHATHLTNEDIALLGDSSTYACFCPTTEADLADGIGPARALASAGSPLTVGSDSQAVIDLLEEARRIELGERLATQERGHFTAAELAAAATVSGHASLGWPDAGQLAPGALADLVAISLGTPRTAGASVATALESVIFGACAADVRDVIVGGRQIVRAGHHLLIDDVPAALARAIGVVLS
jgi:cytosine/adenosine deaminase-related metal-dependent hydrolase